MLYSSEMARALGAGVFAACCFSARSGALEDRGYVENVLNGSRFLEHMREFCGQLLDAWLTPMLASLENPHRRVYRVTLNMVVDMAQEFYR